MVIACVTGSARHAAELTNRVTRHIAATKVESFCFIVFYSVNLKWRGVIDVRDEGPHGVPYFQDT
jgi:hypothetical protein